jgi:hypothetical protein
MICKNDPWFLLFIYFFKKKLQEGLNIYIKLLCTKIEFLRLYTPLWKDLWQPKSVQRSVNKTDNKGNFKKKNSIRLF